VPTRNIAAQAITAGTPVSMVAGIAGKQIVVTGWAVSLSVAGSVLLKGSTSGEVLRTPLLGVGIGMGLPVVRVPLATGESLQLDASATGNVSGYLTYDWQQVYS